MNSVYGNINSASKQIYSTTKYYWYKRYPVSSYTLFDAGSSWKNSSSADGNGLYIKDLYSVNDSFTLYKSYGIYPGSPIINLSDSCNVSFDYNETTHSNGSTIYYLNPFHNGSYFKDSRYNDHIVFKVSSSGSYLEVDGNKYRHNLSISASYYILPSDYSAKYITIKSTKKYSLSSISTGTSTDGSYRTIPVINSSNSGYIVSTISDNSGSNKAYYCDGYYYEYLGYYA